MPLDLFNGLEPHPSQKKFLQSHSRFICFGGLVGPGKTSALCWKIFWLCVNYPRNFGFLSRWVEDHLWDTTLENWKELFPLEKYGDIMRYVGGDRQPDGIEIAARHPDDPDVLSWDYKSVIKLVPLSNPKRFPGGQIGFYGVDQGEQVPDASTWTDLMRRMRRKNIPWVNQHGLMTANYEANFDWIQEMFIDHKVENRSMPPEEAAKFEFIEADPAETDANFGPAYRKEQLAVLPPLKAKTLIQGINVRTIGRVYKEWNEEVHVKNFEFQQVAEEYGGLNYILAYDYGMSPDPTAVVFIGVDRAGRCWVRAEHVANDLTVKDNTLGEMKPGHETIVRDIAARIGFPLDRARFTAGWDVFGKRHTGLRICDEWGRDFPWQPANCDVDAGIMRVNTLLQTCPKRVDSEEKDIPLLIIHTECEQAKYSFQYYKYADDGSGKPQKKQTPGIKDVADAIRMGVMEAITPRSPAPAKSSVLTAKTYDQIIKARKRGRKEGFWIPVIGGVDPASERRSSKRRLY